jgi:hypothetical protein
MIKEASSGTEKLTLCPACTACPEVEISDQGVTIGEDGNSVRLSHAEWNELVRLVKSGELCEVQGNGAGFAELETSVGSVNSRLMLSSSARARL